MTTIIIISGKLKKKSSRLIVAKDKVEKIAKTDRTKNNFKVIEFTFNYTEWKSIP